jgi:hypothetical protein
MLIGTPRSDVIAEPLHRAILVITKHRRAEPIWKSYPFLSINKFKFLILHNFRVQKGDTRGEEKKSTTKWLVKVVHVSLKCHFYELSSCDTNTEVTDKRDELGTAASRLNVNINGRAFRNLFPSVD